MIKPFYRQYRTTIILSVLLCVFVFPFVISWMLWKHPEHSLYQSHGQLVEPPLTTLFLKSESFEGHHADLLSQQWTMLYVLPNQCDQKCIDNLYITHQIWHGLAKYNDRLRVVMWSTNQQDWEENLASKVPSKMLWMTSEATRKKFFARLPSQWVPRSHGSLYLVDPRGWVIMSFKPGSNFKSVKHDIRYLIQNSQIG